jgi:hypothetical protein
MDDELTEEEKRKRRAGGEIDMGLDELAAHRAKTRPHWREVEGAWEMSVNGKVVAALLPNRDPDFDVAFLSLIVTRDVPDYGWDAVAFATLEDAQRDIEQWWDHARCGEAYRPEAPEFGSAERDAAVVEGLKAIFAVPGEEEALTANQNEPEHLAAVDASAGTEPQPEVMTREAIERDPWNAVALDLPVEASKELLYEAARAARDCRFALDDRAEETESPEQAAVWANLGDQAAARYKEIESRILQPAELLTAEAMRYDPWASVYLDIPPDADMPLLRDAFDAATHCAASVDGPLGPSLDAYVPALLGANETREMNFVRATERMDELDALIAARDLADSEQLTLDDVATLRKLTPYQNRIAARLTTAISDRATK